MARFHAARAPTEFSPSSLRAGASFSAASYAATASSYLPRKNSRLPVRYSALAFTSTGVEGSFATMRTTRSAQSTSSDRCSPGSPPPGAAGAPCAPGIPGGCCCGAGSGVVGLPRLPPRGLAPLLGSSPKRAPKRSATRNRASPRSKLAFERVRTLSGVPSSPPLHCPVDRYCSSTSDAFAGSPPSREPIAWSTAGEWRVKKPSWQPTVRSSATPVAARMPFRRPFSGGGGGSFGKGARRRASGTKASTRSSRSANAVG